MPQQSKSIKKILVANRGEIASRIFRTCHSMGIASVGIFSEADKNAPYLDSCDESVCIGPAPSSESYLNIDAIVNAAQKTGAEAIHPGYGFLAENPALAIACEDAGLTFIGPSARSIEILGSKQAAKSIAKKLGVPTLPNYEIDKPQEMSFPVLLKASAGGGGKGMQVIRSPEKLVEAYNSAQRLAQGAFGDDTILIERFIEKPRHIEVQILGDIHGRILHLGERDCSTQRRHQKIIEESPAFGISDSLREKLYDASLRIAKELQYYSAGTVEFIVDADESFYFLEVNTRLQVEHGVTELRCGLDLVREQIQVARGHALSFSQDELLFSGAALQCRIYAEDPSNSFLPQSGKIAFWKHASSDLRVDSAVESGSTVSIHYDPMIAKFLVHKATREEAIDSMRRHLGQLFCVGIASNRDFLIRLLDSDIFRSGAMHTNYLNHEAKAFSETRGETTGLLPHLLFAAAFLQHESRLSPIPSLAQGFRNSPWRSEILHIEVDGTTHTIHYRRTKDASWEIAIDLQEEYPGQVEDWSSSQHAQALLKSEDELVVEVDGHRCCLPFFQQEELVFFALPSHSVHLRLQPRFPVAQEEEIRGACRAPTPAKLVALLVKEGDTVTKGQPLLVLEAMKMEHKILANQDGTITKLNGELGSQVEAEQLLAVIEP